jgi:hypothetical protein
MTAGRGIAHSERTPANARRGGDGLFGIQSWIDREPNLITCGRAIYSLQHKVKTEGQLQFADHDDRRLFSPQGDQIAAADLPLTVNPSASGNASPACKGQSRASSHWAGACMPWITNRLVLVNNRYLSA